MKIGFVVAMMGAAVVVAGNAQAAHPFPASKHHAPSRHHNSSTKHASSTKKRQHEAASSHGVTAIPSSGVKLYCPAHKSPLLVRKSTQGSGTTVTVICR